MSDEYDGGNLAGVRGAVRFRTGLGKPVAVFEAHHYALVPWQEWSAQYAGPVRLLSFDYHTDKHRAFLRHAFRVAGEDLGNLEVEAEKIRLARLGSLSGCDPASIAAAVVDLKHDEHIDAALKCGILDLAFVVSRDDQGHIESNEQIAFDQEWEAKDGLPWWMLNIPRPPHSKNSTYRIPEDRLIILPKETHCQTEADERRWRDGVLESVFLRDRLDRISRICATGGVPDLFDLPFILDIDLDAFNTRRAVSPIDAEVFYELIRRAIGVTIAREPGCVADLQLAGENLSADWLEPRILEHIQAALK